MHAHQQRTETTKRWPRWLTMTTALLMMLPLMGASRCGSSEDGALEFNERCENGVDDNEDGRVDCEDPQCAFYPKCSTQEGEHCYNGRDDNGDGAVDCADEACKATFICAADGEDCVNQRDDDGDGKTDCEDEACSNTAACLPGAENCTNGQDDDGDGSIDCDDDDCKQVFVCLIKTELPDNGTDDDGDGKIDCEDEDYRNTGLCTDNGENCTNGQDDDGDGTSDCADVDCANTIFCLLLAEDCLNGIDDNGDGKTDCDDNLCIGTASCLPRPEQCTNGRDDDGNGLTDCEDPRCATLHICLENGERPGNGLDDDGDGLIDCDDPDLTGDPSCAPPIEVCGDQQDNDGDGDVDCEDTDCMGDASCIEMNCADELDDDNDGDTDCEDADCALAPNCLEEICGDNTDNNQDGVVDENCACVPDAGDLGVCADAVVNPEDGTCQAPGFQLVEDACDALDNDCDGIVDEGCDCTHPSGSGDGVCAMATISEVSGDCEAPDYEADEVMCDILDNDCDGIADENCVCAHPSGSFEGVCAMAATDPTTGNCLAPGYETNETSCDGDDNDCDGDIDEGCGCAHPSGLTAGVCGLATIDFATGECVAAGYETDETSCDGVDNDCDGVVDESCTCVHPQGTQGVCAMATVDANNGACAAPNFQLDEILCDGADNDCDGVIDENCACAHPSGSSDGVCASAFIDPSGTGCIASAFETTEASCDTQDNDCDGVIDEGCACAHPRGTQGVCAGALIDAQGQCSPANFELIETSCTGGLDNDCDGDVDCDDSDCDGDAACTELICDNGMDDDNDGPIDCMDSDCQSQPVCTLEDCNNAIDDNGDGVINEGCPCVHPQGTQGVCAAALVDPTSGACVAQDFETTESSCDSKDNNCDGIIDENCACAHPQGTQGVCAMAMVDATNGVCTAPDYEMDETACDMLDNDCDGVIDENCACPHPSGSSDGVCAGAVISAANGNCIAADYQSDETACDMLDNDCDGIIDENCFCPHPQGSQGVCGMALVSPSDGTCEAPNFETTEFSCDTLDNNCDGVVDEGCACNHPNGTDGVCAGATVSPSGLCEAPGFEAPETACDTQDNDCDGITDENCTCAHPSGSSDGVCAAAAISPADGACVAANYQMNESSCDSLDNDCDGIIDEGCACAHPSGSSDGVCGMATVSPLDGTCVAMDYEAGERTCDSQDNDCDGIVDEGCPCSHPSGSSLGVCGMAQVSAADGSCAAAGFEMTESLCDGEDNDCDGTIDEGCPCVHANGDQGVCAMAIIEAGTGACKAPGFEDPETMCDSEDNDCDGITDEHCPCSHPSGSTLGVCATATIDEQSGVCDSLDYEPTETLCDNKDNNCDGVTDEFCPCSHPSGSTLGTCAFSSIDPSSGLCEAKDYEATETTCDDGVDNNCDGHTDCDDAACASAPACQDPCTVNIDTDGDGQIACGDHDCRNSAPNCNLENCPTSGPGTDDFNGNGLFGSADPDCFAFDYTWTIYRPQEICGDGDDNDGDSFIDCVDVDCADHHSCTGLEACDDFIDNDGDGAVDCDDSDCTFDYKCYRGGEVYCGAHGDMSDDDNDGLVNCADNDCGRDPYCHTEKCYDFVDNDGDGLTDFFDPDCAGLKLESGGEVCDDNIDNDGDGYVDCASFGCGDSSPTCHNEVDCDDGLDNNRNGLIDCADPQCAGIGPCGGTAQTEICGNSNDDDGDQLIGCADPDCKSDPSCQFEVCDNGFDDDNNGETDCDDVACVSLEICKPEYCGEIESATGVAYPPTLDENSNERRGCSDTFACSHFDNPLAIHCQEEFPYDCEQGTDRNGNGLVGCGEPTCYDHINQGLTSLDCSDFSDLEDCFDGSDNDGDGFVDCLDIDCVASGACAPRETDCQDGKDNDGDLYFDCGDIDCQFDSYCAGEEFACTNGLDDDNDGLKDCDDPDCQKSTCIEDCTDTVDNDANTYVDCEDLVCAQDFACIETTCGDGSDNDGDGKIDCDDEDCEFASECVEFACDNGTDDDGDGDIDCDDSDCQYASNCYEFSCRDGFDDEGDGFVDCDDSDCANNPDCGEFLCDDGSDNDGDGYIDCSDSECFDDPACVGPGPDMDPKDM